ncbi:MAG: hypothetical protein IPM26_14305 [Saprospiraceae bacterium]|nr:hypothetical protein [Saprospiraceae bacterium]
MRKLVLSIVWIWYGLMALYGQGKEKPYQLLLNNEVFRGQIEYMVDNGRVDILTEEYAIEIEWAKNWKHSIGQAIWYGLQTNKTPGIVLLLENEKEYRNFIRLNTALNYAGMEGKVKTWYLRTDNMDFDGEKRLPRPEIKPPPGPEGEAAPLRYVINRRSGIRHNSNCGDFNCRNCVPATAEEGRACRRCGG